MTERCQSTPMYKRMQILLRLSHLGILISYNHAIEKSRLSPVVTSTCENLIRIDLAKIESSIQQKDLITRQRRLEARRKLASLKMSSQVIVNISREEEAAHKWKGWPTTTPLATNRSLTRAARRWQEVEEDRKSKRSSHLNIVRAMKVLRRRAHHTAKRIRKEKSRRAEVEAITPSSKSQEKKKTSAWSRRTHTQMTTAKWRSRARDLELPNPNEELRRGGPRPKHFWISNKRVLLRMTINMMTKMTRKCCMDIMR